MLSQYKNIQVAVDGSKEADLAFSKAVAIAKRNHATLEILHVIDTRSFQNVSSFDSAMVEQVSKDAEKRMPLRLALKMFTTLLNLVHLRQSLDMTSLRSTILI